MLYNRVEENYFVRTNCISDIQFDTGGVREKENVEEERAAKGPKRKASQRKTTLNGNCHKRPGFLIVDPLSLF